MSDQEMMEALCNKVSQEVSYKLSDMVLSYPRFLRPLVLATVQACLNAQMGTMPEKDRQLYDAALHKMVVATIPQAMDPRRGGG